jgi:Protein of unknown function (DUF1573)
MHQRRAALCVAIVLLVEGCGRSPSATTSGPFLKADRIDHELLPDDLSETNARFFLKNVGDRSLRIENSITTTCGCAVAHLKTHELLPDQQTEMIVRFSRPPIGHREFVVTVRCDAPATPKLDLRVTAWARSSTPRIVQVAPSSLVLSADSNEVDFTVATLESEMQPLVTSVDCDLPAVRISAPEVSVTEIDLGGFVAKSYRYRVIADATRWTGVASGTIRINAISGKDSGRTIPVDIGSLSPIIASHRTLLANHTQGARLPEWNVSIYRRSAIESFEVLSATSDSGWLQVDRSQSVLDASNGQPQEGCLARLHVYLLNYPERLPARAEVVLTTSHASWRELRIPVIIFGEAEEE